MDLFFVSQALKYTTATTQLLTDMENPIYKEMGVGPQLVPVVCIDTTGVPFVQGKSQEACVLYGTTCADRNLKTPTTAEEKKQATECNDNLDKCQQCGGNLIEY